MQLKQERLTTDRLELRPWCLDDAPALFELARDPQRRASGGLATSYER